VIEIDDEDFLDVPIVKFEPKNMKDMELEEIPIEDVLWMPDESYDKFQKRVNAKLSSFDQELIDAKLSAFDREIAKLRATDKAAAAILARIDAGESATDIFTDLRKLDINAQNKIGLYILAHDTSEDT
jgi:hypothetical protein